MTPINEHGQPIGEPVDWTPRPAPGRMVLEGRHARLEPIEAGHAVALFAALGSDVLWTYRPDTCPVDAAELGGRFGALATATESRTWAIAPTGDVPQGMLSLLRIDPANGSAEVAAVIYGPGLQRTTAATEAVVLLGTHVFEELGYRRFEWKCDSLNEPSRRAAVRLGFTYEGRFRNALVYKDRNRDTDWFSITDAEWPARRVAYDAWLDPGNFEDDRQRRSLGDIFLEQHGRRAGCWLFGPLRSGKDPAIDHSVRGVSLGHAGGIPRAQRRDSPDRRDSPRPGRRPAGAGREVDSLLNGGWTGPAAGAFAGGWNDWSNDADGVLAALDATRQLMTQAVVDLEHTDGGVAARAASLHSKLGVV